MLTGFDPSSTVWCYLLFIQVPSDGSLIESVPTLGLDRVVWAVGLTELSS